MSDNLIERWRGSLLVGADALEDAAGMCADGASPNRERAKKFQDASDLLRLAAESLPE
jgi:hypothetical protein